jgi:hypothetical protein
VARIGSVVWVGRIEPIDRVDIRVPRRSKPNYLL